MNNHPKLQNLGYARILHVPLCFVPCSFWPTFPPLIAYSKSTHLVKSSGNPEMPGCGNIGRYCLKAREQEGAGDARLHLELLGSCTGRDPAPAKLGRKSSTSEVWILDPPGLATCCYLVYLLLKLTNLQYLVNTVELVHFLKQCPFHKHLSSKFRLEKITSLRQFIF